MSALTSLLVRDRVVPVSKIEEALQSQVFLGGDIEIILLEMNLVPEDVLSAYRAALFDLLPATRQEVMGASREVLRRVPPDLARALGIVPIFFEGRSLVVAAWEPLYEPRLQEVEAELGCELTVRIVNQARLAAELSRHYGFELDARLRRLADALRRRDPGNVPYVRPPTTSVRPVLEFEEDANEIEIAPEPESAPLAPVEPALRASEPEQAYAQLAEVAESETTQLPPGVSLAIAELVELPLTLERATELLQQAAQRDDVLFVLLRYVQQFFDFVGIFSVGKEGVRPRMAHGAGFGRAPIEQALIPAPSVGMFADVLRERRPLLGVFGSAPEEHEAAAILGRQTGRLGLLAPIELNDRVVLLVYAERARPGLGLEHASVVQGIVPAVVAGLRRVILGSKAQRRPGPRAGLEEHGRSANGAAPASAPVLASGSDSGSEDTRDDVVPVRDPAPEGSELSAVDLDAFERLAREMLGPGPTPRTLARAGTESRDDALVRERIPGIPRSAPPPPLHDAPSGAHVTGGYRYGGAAVAQERTSGVELVVPAVPKEAASPEAAKLAQPAERLFEDEKGPRQRLSLVERVDAVPSVIIDMGEGVESLIESLLRAPPGTHPPEVDELVQIGEGVLPVLVQRFPGPLWFDRTRPHKRRPRGRDVSAVARAMAVFGERAAPYLASLLGSGDADRCYYALLVAGEIVHPDLIDPVARRVLDRDESLRAVALEVLRSYAALPQYDAVVRAIADLTERPGKDPRRQRLAVDALGELRDARTLPVLLARLSDRDEEIVRAAHRSLVVLTGQDLGVNPRKWESWAEGWGRAHRVEWLIEALLHHEEQVRALAGEELKLLTQQYFGYHPALPRRDREVAQRKYREWWELEGRVAFGR